MSVWASPSCDRVFHSALSTSRDVFQPRCLFRQHSREGLLPLLGRLRHGFIEDRGALHRRHRACAIDFPSPRLRRAASALHDERVVCRVKSFFLHGRSNGDGRLRFQISRAGHSVVRGDPRKPINIGNTAPASPLPKLGDLMPLVEAVLIFVFVLLTRCQNLGRRAGMTKT